jgi:pseudaminic acid biosynthesis-associated methylase
MNTESFWAGEFGDQYHSRNQIDWRARIPFWEDVIDQTGARSVFEVGAGPGWNLSAIRELYPRVGLHGCEINPKGEAQAAMCGINLHRSDALRALANYTGTIELVFTAGVLIHVGPDEIEATMKAIINASARFVLSVEYESEQVEEVEYRGHAGKLWRRPFGKMYEAMGLKLVKRWDAGPGFDRCTAVLLERV